MGFGKDMKGKPSHEAIVRVQDAELRLLDTIQHFIMMRIDNDRKYTTGLTKMLQAATKSENSEFKKCCSVFAAWEVVLQETDNLVKIIKSNSDHLQTSSLEILSQLINEKKLAKKRYLDERNRLDSEFVKIQEELAKNKSEYSKSFERLTTDKAKFLDLQLKGKPGPKVDEAKSKFYRSAAQLHKQHNDYIISVNNAHEHQILMRDIALPALLDWHQDGQEAFVHKVKYILVDYLKHTDTSSADFQVITENISHAVGAIQSGKEYSGTFIDLHKSSLPPPTDFTFEDKLLEAYSGSLKAGVIEINDLTVELLKERLAKLTEEIQVIKGKISTVSTEQQKISLEVHKLSACIGESIENLNNYLVKRSQAETSARELLELEANLKKLEKLAALMQEPLDKLGSDPAPPTPDIENEGEFDNNFGLPPQSGTLMKSLAKINPFKRGVKDSNDQSVSNSDDNSDDRGERKRSAIGYEKLSVWLCKVGA